MFSLILARWIELRAPRQRYIDRLILGTTTVLHIQMTIMKCHIRMCVSYIQHAYSLRICGFRRWAWWLASAFSLQQHTSIYNNTIYARRNSAQHWLDVFFSLSVREMRKMIFQRKKEKKRTKEAKKEKRERKTQERIKQSQNVAREWKGGRCRLF